MTTDLSQSLDGFFHILMDEPRDLTRNTNLSAPQKNAQYSGCADTRILRVSKYGCHRLEILEILLKIKSPIRCCWTSQMCDLRSAIIAVEVENAWNCL